MSPIVAALAGTPLETIWPSLPHLDGRVDPFSFRQRMALFARLIEATSRDGRFGPEGEANPFWGYVFQTHWQWRSGRYRLSTDDNAIDPDDDAIDPDSLWCHGNYTLSVIPYLAAVRAGLAPGDLAIMPPPASSVRYAGGGGSTGPISVPPDMEPAVRAWDAFMVTLGTWRGRDTEPIRFALWDAHKASLEGLAEARTLLAGPYAATELTFFDGWVRMVDFLAAAAWRTDIEFMRSNALDALPERMLRADDVPGRIPDMDASINANLASMVALMSQSDRRFALSLWLWRRAMRTRKARDEVLEMLAAQFAPTKDNAAARRRLLRYTIGR